MYARRGGGISHINPDPDKVKKLMNDGYEILDDNMEVISDPVEEAEKEEEEHTMSGSWDDFVKFCKENNVII